MHKNRAREKKKSKAEDGKHVRGTMPESSTQIEALAAATMTTRVPSKHINAWSSWFKCRRECPPARMHTEHTVHVQNCTKNVQLYLDSSPWLFHCEKSHKKEKGENKLTPDFDTRESRVRISIWECFAHRLPYFPISPVQDKVPCLKFDSLYTTANKCATSETRKLAEHLKLVQ